MKRECGMQAIILCAGGGSRIKNVTGNKPKCLLRVGGATVLDRQLDAVEKYTDTAPVVVVGYEAAQVERHLAGRNVRFVTNPEYASTNVITSLWYGLSAVNDDSVLLYMPGDLVFDDVIIGLIMREQAGVTLAVQKRPCDEEAVKVIAEKGRVVNIGKGLPAGRETLEFTGMMKVDAAVLKRFKRMVDDIIGQGGKNGYVFTALQKMIEKGVDVGCADVEGRLWEEIDFEEDYERAKTKFAGMGLFTSLLARPVRRSQRRKCFSEGGRAPRKDV